MYILQISLNLYIYIYIYIILLNLCIFQHHIYSPDTENVAPVHSHIQRSSPVSSRPAVVVQQEQLIASHSDEFMDSGMYIIEFMYILKRCLNLYILLNLCIF